MVRHESDLFPIVEELLFGRSDSISIVLPYWAVKKEIGPLLRRLLDKTFIPVRSATPKEWVVCCDTRCKAINFVTHVEQADRYSALVIISAGD